MLDFLGIQADRADHLLHDQLLAYIVNDHHTGPIDLAPLDLRLFRKEHQIKSLEVIWVRLV